MIVYVLTNRVNGKRYIGQTSRALGVRWTQHIKDSKSGEYAINRAIRKYGAHNFEVAMLATADSLAKLNELERQYVAEFGTFGGNGYNQTIGGDGVMLCRKHSVETREKISALQIGRKQSPEAVAKRIATQIGRPLSPEHRKKISEANKGQTRSPETRARLVASHLGKKPSDETRRRMSVAQSLRKRAPRKRENAHLDSAIAELMLQGLSQRAIAFQLGITRGLVRQSFKHQPQQVRTSAPRPKHGREASKWWLEAVKVGTTPKDAREVCWTYAQLISMKDGYRPPGIVEI